MYSKYYENRTKVTLSKPSHSYAKVLMDLKNQREKLSTRSRGRRAAWLETLN